MSENLWLSDVLKGYRKKHCANLGYYWTFCFGKGDVITKNDSNQNIKETMVGDNVMTEICSGLLSN